MILTPTQSFIVIILIGTATFLTRVLPFILFPDNKQTPKYIEYLGKVLPYSAIGMLVVYCVKEISFVKSPFALPEVFSIIIITILHKWKQNTLLSIGGGTALYMIIIQGNYFS